MLYIWTDLSLVDKKDLIYDINACFNLLNLKDEFTDSTSNSIMTLVDGVHWRDEDVIKTKFGTTTMMNLSTGCKTALLACKYGRTKFISALECGENVVTLLLYLSMSKDINLYTTSPLGGSYPQSLTGFVNNQLYKGFDIYLNQPFEKRW